MPEKRRGMFRDTINRLFKAQMDKPSSYASHHTAYGCFLLPRRFFQNIRLPIHNADAAFQIIVKQSKLFRTVPGVKFGHGIRDRGKNLPDRVQVFVEGFDDHDAQIFRIFGAAHIACLFQAIDHTGYGSCRQAGHFCQLASRRLAHAQDDVQTFMVGKMQSKGMGDRLVKHQGMGGVSSGSIKQCTNKLFPGRIMLVHSQFPRSAMQVWQMLQNHASHYTIGSEKMSLASSNPLKV